MPTLPNSVIAAALRSAGHASSAEMLDEASRRIERQIAEDESLSTMPAEAPAEPHQAN